MARVRKVVRAAHLGIIFVSLQLRAHRSKPRRLLNGYENVFRICVLGVCRFDSHGCHIQPLDAEGIVVWGIRDSFSTIRFPLIAVPASRAPAPPHKAPHTFTEPACKNFARTSLPIAPV